MQQPTVLRTAMQLDKVADTSQRGFLGGAAHPNRHVMSAVIVVALLLTALVAWAAFFRPVRVPIAAVESNLSEQVFGLGVVGSRIQSNIGFKVPGILVALYADQGYRVKAGQVLAQLDARDVEAQLAVARAGVVQAQANIEKANADVASATATFKNVGYIKDRDQRLLKKGTVSVEQAQTDDANLRVATANVEVAKSEIGVAQAALKSAQAQVSYEQATLDYYTLRAPYDAWVVSRNLELGSMPNPGQSVFTLVPWSTIWVQGYVDERLAGHFSVGQPAEIILRSNPATHLPGHVARIEIQSDPVNEERVVDVGFDDVPVNIHLAEQAEVLITIAILAHAVAVAPNAVSGLSEPLSDLYRRAKPQGWVWTVENGRLARRQVTFGPELLDGRLPIVDGLPAGAAVVAAPVPGLRVGRAAEVVRQ